VPIPSLHYLASLNHAPVVQVEGERAQHANVLKTRQRPISNGSNLGIYHEQCGSHNRRKIETRKFGKSSEFLHQRVIVHVAAGRASMQYDSLLRLLKQRNLLFQFTEYA
jgi:hypothetical protein